MDSGGTGKKSAEESESLYVGSSALSSGASYLIATSLSSSIIVYINANNYYISVGMRFGAT